MFEIRNVFFLLPVVIAYVTQGAKLDQYLGILFWSFVPVFFLDNKSFLYLHRQNSFLSLSIISALVFWPWVVLLKGVVCWNSFLSSYGKIWLFMLSYKVFSNGFLKESTRSIKYLILILAVSEAALLLVRNDRLGPLGGYLEGNPNYSAVLMACGLILCVDLIRDQKPFHLRLLCGFALVLLLIGVYFVRTRSMVLGLLASYCVLFRFRFRPILILAGVLLIAVFFFLDPFLNYFKLTENIGTKEYIGRLVIWKTAALAIQHSPWFGYGLGNFEIAYRLFQQPNLEVIRFDKSTIFAHNDYLQVGTELGIIGFIVCISSIYLWFIKVGKSLYYKGQEQWILGIVVYYAISSFFNFNLYLPLHIILISLVMGVGESVVTGISTSLGKSSPHYWRKIGLFFVIGWGAFYVVLAIPSPLKEALKTNRFDSYFWSRSARYESSRREISEAETRGLFMKAISLAPSHAPFWLEMAVFELNRNQPTKAKKAYLRAAELEPAAAVPWCGLALVAKAENKKALMAQHFARCLEKKRKYGFMAKSSNYSEALYAVDDQKIERLLEKTHYPFSSNH